MKCTTNSRKIPVAKDPSFTVISYIFYFQPVKKRVGKRCKNPNVRKCYIIINMTAAFDINFKFLF